MSDPRLQLMEAIALRRTVAVNYNGKRIRLAPHLLFERHGDLSLVALNLDKVWRSDEEPRLGQFKLSGLSEVELSEDGFEPLEGFDGTPPRPDDTAILAV
jgi:hypothetical protein